MKTNLGYGQQCL
ncbi:hypothetical protein CPC197_0253A, partial [Chlamydia psittaci C1/97]